MHFWGILQYFAIPFYPVLWLMISHEFSFRGRRKFSANPVILFVIPILVFLARVTNDWHHLYYSSVNIVYNGYFYVLILGKGPLYYVQFVYAFLLIAVSSYGYIRLARQSDAEMRSLTIRLVFIAIFPWLGFLPMILPSMNIGIDNIALILPLSALLFATVIHDKNFFPLRARAMEQSFSSDQQGIVLFNQKNILIDANPFALSIFPDLQKYLNHPLPHFSERSPFYGCLKSKDGKNDFEVNGRTFYFHASQLLDKKGRFIGTFGVFVDITERVAMTNELLASKREIAHLVYHDPLTNLYNRRYLVELLQSNLPDQYPMAMIYLDFNDLKKVNDLLGHIRGDDVLCKFASILSQCLEKNGYAFRLGGDEFMVLQSHATVEDINHLILCIQTACAASPELSFSIGHSIMKDAEDYERAFKEAEDRMYTQKRAREKTIQSK